jgi:polyisoprenyl-phosphate glycosyltransferase
MNLSVIVPLRDEQDNVSLLYQRIRAVLNTLALGRYEMIFIDDGSKDGTWPLIAELAAKDKQVRGLRLSRNFGQQNALTAGLDHATGDAVVMMDGDLQHPPEVIPQLVAKWREGYDIVYTVRERNESYGWFKNSLSGMFAMVFNKLADVQVGEGVTDFRIIGRAALDAIRGLKERRRFLRGLVHWVGFKTTAISYTAPVRVAGRTKYSLSKSISLAVVGLLSFSSRPLYWSGFLGLVSTFASFIYIVYAIYAKFNGFIVPGWASILICVLFLGGIQLIMIGILGSYLAMVYEEVKGRPSYIVQTEAGVSGAG